MTLNNKTLGVAGIIGAPFLAAEMLSGQVANSAGPQVTLGWGAIFDLIYMLGWMCSIYALLRAGAAGDQKWTRNVLKTQLIFLSIANVYNIWGSIGIGTDHLIFNLMDLFWPISNAFMLVTGTAIIKANVLQGWKKYVPLVVGLWLPSAMLPMAVFGRVTGTLYFGLAYSIVAWALLGIVAYRTRPQQVVYNHFGHPKLAIVED